MTTRAAPGHAWDTTARVLHWLVAALILVQFALGWMAVRWHLSPAKLDLFVWHKSTGMLILALVLLRLSWRLAITAPPLPSAMPRWEQFAARASHGLLYVLMLAMPLSGWVLNSAAGVPFRIFRLLPLPAITAPDKQVEHWASRVHLGLWIVLAALLVLHIGAALRHHFILRDGVLLGMLTDKGTS